MKALSSQFTNAADYELEELRAMRDHESALLASFDFTARLYPLKRCTKRYKDTDNFHGMYGP
jgi:hypothetical protein